MPSAVAERLHLQPQATVGKDKQPTLCPAPTGTGEPAWRAPRDRRTGLASREAPGCHPTGEPARRQIRSDKQRPPERLVLYSV
jgi:hypothetical protein